MRIGRRQRTRVRWSLLASRESKIIVIVSSIIVIVGLIMFMSATSAISFDAYGDSYALLKRQVIRGIVPGIILFLLAAVGPIRIMQRWRLVWYVATIILIGLSFVPSLGIVLNGSRSWIHVGSITIQPSELAKVTFVFWLCSWFGSVGSKSVATSGFWSFWIHCGVVLAVIAAQPDIGTMCLFGAVAVAVYVASGAPLRHFGVLIPLGLLCLGALLIASPVRLQRLTTYMNPTADPQDSGYHLNQSLIAIGSGHWLGVGIGKSQQKFDYVPEIANDSVFSIIAEEWGFVRSSLLVMLYAVLVAMGIHVGMRSVDSRDGLLAIGAVSFIAIQTIVNIGAMVGLVPLTGLPLPFISLGGTNSVALLCLLGILVNVSNRLPHHA